eukprot:6208534-Pleurochrysis_carterae.AAC.3
MDANILRKAWFKRFAACVRAGLARVTLNIAWRQVKKDGRYQKSLGVHISSESTFTGRLEGGRTKATFARAAVQSLRKPCAHCFRHPAVARESQYRMTQHA